MKKKSLLTALIASIMAVSMLSGCGEAADPVPAATNLPPTMPHPAARQLSTS